VPHRMCAFRLASVRSASRMGPARRCRCRTFAISAGGRPLPETYGAGPRRRMCAVPTGERPLPEASWGLTHRLPALDVCHTGGGRRPKAYGTRLRRAADRPEPYVTWRVVHAPACRTPPGLPRATERVVHRRGRTTPHIPSHSIGRVASDRACGRSASRACLRPFGRVRRFLTPSAAPWLRRTVDPRRFAAVRAPRPVHTSDEASVPSA